MNRATAAATVLVALGPVAALVPSPATAAPASAPTSTEARSAGPAYAVVARLDKSEVVAGEDGVRITGRVTPAAAGEKVTLLQRLEGKKRWSSTGKAIIKRNGTFVLKDAPHRPGVRHYRVLKPASNGLQAGRSRELELAVWVWERLAYRMVGASAGITRDLSPAYSVLSMQTPGAAGHIEFPLGGACRSLKATYFLTDEFGSGATGSVTVSVDGVAEVTHALPAGMIVRDHVIDVTDAFRVRFDVVASASPAGTAAVGAPEVLCLA